MRSKGRFLEVGMLACILALAAYLRLVNLADNPGWYTDEGTHLDIARQLLAGQVQYLALNQSTLLFSRLPLFEELLAMWSRLFGLGMEPLRALTGTLGVISVAALYAVTRRISRDRVLALLAAALLAIYPSAVLYSRFGFSYNLLAPLLLIALWGMSEYSATQPSTSLRAHSERNEVKSKNARRSTQAAPRHWLVVAALSIGLGAISEVWAWMLIALLVISVLIRNWRDLVWSVPLALLPLSLYALIMLSTAPPAFIFDLSFVLSRLNQLSFAQQAATLWQNITTLSAQDGWFALGALGLFTLRPARVRWIVLVFAAVPFVLLGRTTALFSLSAYYLIPLLPFVALGAASLIRNGVRGVLERLFYERQRCFTAASILLFTTVVCGTAVLPLIDQIHHRFQTDIDPFLINATDARQAAAFVNERVSVDDLVIVSPSIAWLIESNVADFQMPIAYRGQVTPHLPADVPPDRWAFDPGYQRARFVIVDNLWRNWAVPDVPGVRDMLIDVETWPLALKSGEVEVYVNPRGRDTFDVN
jgi:hypothetical protein